MNPTENSLSIVSALGRISDCVFVLDHNGQLTYINEASINYFNLSNENLLGKTLTDILHPDLLDKLEPEIKYSLLHQKERRIEIQWSIQPIKWLEVHIYSSYDGVTLFARDITSIKKVQETIEDKHKKFELLSEAANHLLYKNEPKEILDSLFEELSGYLDLDVYFNYEYDVSRNKLRLMNFKGIPDSVAKEIEWLEFGEAICGCVARDLNRIVAEHIDQSDDVRVQLVKGFGIKAYACHPLMSYGKFIGTLSFGSSKRQKFSEEELDLIFTICNQVAITIDRIHLFTELKKKREEAEIANKAKSEFLSMMSHELRTPLNSILGFAQILEEDTREPLTQKQKGKIQKILKSSRHLLSLINGILSIGKIESKENFLESRVMTVNSVISETLKIMKPLADKKAIKIRNKVGQNGQIRIKVNGTKFLQIMLNLLSNAIKYTEENGKVEITSELEDHIMKIIVTDNGIGIPSEEHESIFRPFYRIFNREMNIEGTGIGLSIVKQYVMEMGGNVSVKSKLGQGRLYHYNPNLIRIVQNIMNFWGGMMMLPIKVLLVDDNEDSIEILDYFIRDLADFQIIGLCTNGEQLVDEVILKKPDLVLADINMPKKDGLMAIKECLSFYPNLKFILITGYDSHAIEAFKLSAVDYIVKPFEKARLLQALGKAKSLINFEKDPKQLSPNIQMKNLQLKEKNKSRYIPFDDIYFIEKTEKKCLVYTKVEVYETNETLSKLLSRLDDTFFYAHRSYIINLEKVSHITPRNETYIVQFLNYNKKASISKLKVSEVRERISSLYE